MCTYPYSFSIDANILLRAGTCKSLPIYRAVVQIFKFDDFVLNQS